MPRISLIVAVSDNGVIGADGRLPWRLPADLRHFKAVTMGKPIVMGRKTFESIGRPLPGRRNIVVTRRREFPADGCDVVGSVEEAIQAAAGAEELMVIGGSLLYTAFLPMTDRIYLTRVHAEIDGDAHFPEPDASAWACTESRRVEADAANPFAMTFSVLERGPLVN